MRKTVLATLATASLLTACGGTEVIYVTPATEAPTETDSATDTTARKTTSTQPAATRPPASIPTTPATYDPEAYDTFLWESVNEFWWLFTGEQLLAMGLLVCEAFDDGYTLDEVTEELVSVLTNINSPQFMEGLAAVTAGALTYLCPEHSYWLSSI